MGEVDEEEEEDVCSVTMNQLGKRKERMIPM